VHVLLELNKLHEAAGMHGLAVVCQSCAG
jgi:hypothetical protein